MIHHHPSSQKKKSDAIVNRLLNSVGLHRNISISSDANTLPSSTSLDNDISLEQLTKKHRTLTPAPHKVARHASISDSEEIDDNSGEDSYNDDEEDTTDESYTDEYIGDSEEESETEFERQRRLHALGQAPAPQTNSNNNRDNNDNINVYRNEEDEEEYPVTSPSATRNHRGHLKSNTLMEKFSNKIGKKFRF